MSAEVTAGSPSKHSDRLRGITFAKQFPNVAEPLRGLFVADQVAATRDRVDWRVISAVPWVPRWLAGLLGKAYVRGDADFAGIRVVHPRYPVLPRRMLYTTVAPLVARASSRAFSRIQAEHRPQFVHVHALYPSGAAVRRLASSAGVPYVVTIHGSDLYSNLVRPAWAEELRQTVSVAAAVIAVSESLARDAVAMIGADPRRVLVIPDTYDETRFHYVARMPHAGPLRLVSVGRLVDVKGHDILLQAFARVVAEGLDATLEIVGGGPERQSLMRLAADLGVDDRVRMRGALGEDELVSALAEADAFVMASRKEGFGVALVEALATGLPAIATRSGGPEAILDDASGLLVSPEDPDDLSRALRELASRIDSYDRASIAARVRSRYGAEVIGQRLVDLYRAVISDEVEAHVAGGARHA